MKATVLPGQTIVVSQPLTFSGIAAIYGASDGGAGGVAVVTNHALLTSDGTLSITGGNGSSATERSGRGGELEVTGFLTSEGQISLAGGRYDGLYDQGSGGGGGTLSVSGAMTNDGSLTLGYGSTSFVSHYSGHGGFLSITGVFLNAGVVVAEGADANYSAQVDGASATIENLSTLSNTGSIALEGSVGGAELLNVGSLFNSGTISVSGDSNYGASLRNAGVATNVGLIEARGNYGSSDPYIRPVGGVVSNTGVFTNDGTMVALGGYAFGGPGGVLEVTAGTLTNYGLLAAAGGAAGRQGYFGGYSGGAGGYLTVSGNGLLINKGTIVAQSGRLPAGGMGTPGLGGEISISNEFNQSGGDLDDIGSIVLDGSDGSGASARLDIYAGGELQLDGGTVTAVGYFAGQAPVVNDGMIYGHGLLNVGSISNYGIISQSIIDGLTIMGNITGVGTLDQSGGTLTIDGVIGSGQTLLISSGGIVTGIGNAGAVVESYSQNSSRLELTGGGTGTLNAADTNLTVQLAQASTLTLSAQGFLTAVGSSGADTIVAEAAGQTLKGEGGGDTLFGSAATGDTFLGTSAQLNGDVIGDFAGSDVIDVTDLVPGAGLSLAYAQGDGQGVLTLSEAGTSTAITLLGSFAQGDFITAGDGHGGVLVGLG